LCPSCTEKIKNYTNVIPNNVKIQRKDIYKNFYIAPFNHRKMLERSEIDMFNRIESILPRKYRIMAEIPLRRISEKNPLSPAGHSENILHKYIDFGIFDRNFNLCLAIELNDESHREEDKETRDIFLHNILIDFHIPLLTLWSNDENDEDILRFKLRDFIDI